MASDHNRYITAHASAGDRISSTTADGSTGDNSIRPLTTERIDDKNDVNVQQTIIGDDEIVRPPTARTGRSSTETDDSTARAFEQLETKDEKSWFAYLRTRDFYIILVLGYEISTSIHFMRLISDSRIDKSLHSASLLQIPSPPNSSKPAPPCPPSKQSSTTPSSPLYTPPSQSTPTVSRSTSSSSGSTVGNISASPSSTSKATTSPSFATATPPFSPRSS